jgi:hypothetical protein
MTLTITIPPIPPRGNEEREPRYLGLVIPPKIDKQQKEQRREKKRAQLLRRKNILLK